MRKRLRPSYSPEKLAEIYDKGYAYTTADHWLRIGATKELVNWTAQRHRLESFADLSCGDGKIIGDVTHKFKEYHLGDYSSFNIGTATTKLASSFGYVTPYVGSIMETIHDIPKVDLFLCSETLEHVDDPDALLAAIREKTRYLILSTPDSRFDDENEEHYWAWDQNEIYYMLGAAHFGKSTVMTLDFNREFYYDFQIWVAE